MGTYGFMLRQSLDISHERLARDTWQITIHGVEIFEGYRNPVWEYAYDSVFIGDARKLIPSLGVYDLVLINDVLEHLEAHEARTLLDGLLAKTQTVIATTPNRHYPQGSWGGNEAETHRCLLRPADFPHLVFYRRTGDTNFYVCSTRDKHIALLKKAALDCPICLPRFCDRIVLRIQQLRGRVRRLGKRLLGQS
jgi:hypothetical protein